MRNNPFVRGLAVFLCLAMIMGFVPGGILAPVKANAAENDVHPSTGSLVVNGNFENIQTDWAGAWTVTGGSGKTGVVYDATIDSNVAKMYDPDTSAAAELMSAQFAVTGGVAYDISMKLRQDAAFAETAIGDLDVYVFWYDAAGNLLDTNGNLEDGEYYTVVGSIVADAEWDTYALSVNVPAAAAKAAIRLNFFRADANCYYIDDISFAKSPVVLTESFDRGIFSYGWTKSSGANAMVYNGHYYAGTQSLILQTNATVWAQSPAISVIPGYSYTASFMHSKTSYNNGETYSVGSGGRAALIFVDERGTLLQQDVFVVGEQDGWEQANLTARAPANAANMYIKYFVDASYTGDPCFSVDALVVNEIEGEIIQPVEIPLLANGDFSDGTTGWSGALSVNEDGQAVLDATAGASYFKTSNITAAPGETFKITAKVKRTSGEKSGYIGFWYKDANNQYVGDGAISVTYNSDEWTEVELTWTAETGVAYFWIEVGADSRAASSFLIDDIKLEKVNADVELYSCGFEYTTAHHKSEGWVLVNGKYATDIYQPWFEGSRSLHLQSAGASATSPSVSVIAGRTYKADVMTLSVGGSPASMKLVFVDADGAVLSEEAVAVAEGAIYTSADPGANWKADTVSAVAPEGAAKAYVVFEAVENANALGIDEFKITQLAVEEEEEDNTVVVPNYAKYNEDFNVYTSVYAGWTGDYVVTAAGMKLNGSASADIPYVAGAAYAAEAEGAAASVADAKLVLTAEDAVVTSYAVYMLCADDDGDHNCDYCELKISDCEYDNDCDADCNICYEWRTAPHGELTHVPAVDPIDCANPGNVEHWHCESCGENFFDAEATQMADPYRNPVTITVECVRPEGTPDCATIVCEICGNELYGYGEHDLGDAFACQGGTCLKCDQVIEGYGCQNYDGPACLPGNCYYCGEAMEPVAHENGAWAPCQDGECSYGCGLKYPATADHIDDDADGYCDTCWNHLNHSFDNGFDPCYGGECSICWTFVAGEHNWVDGVCDVCDTVCEHDTEEGTCGICGKELVVDLTGTESAPVQLMAPSNNVTISKAPYYYQGYFSGMSLTVIGTGDFSVIYNGNTYAAVDGVANVGVVTSSNPRMPVVFAIDGIGDFAINFTYPAGSMENPAQAQLGDNAASIEANTQGYYWTYTAAFDGELAVTISGADNWMYVVNNITANKYGDYQYSDSDPVVNPYTIKVAAGDEIQIMVNSYDPANMWNTPAAELTINLAYTSINDANLALGTPGLSLGAFIGLQSAIFKSKINGGDFDEAYFIYKHNTFDADGNAAVVTTQGEYLDYGSYLVADVPVNAKQMADVFEITPVYVKDGVTYYGVTNTTSVKEQAMIKVNAAGTDDKTVKTAAICVAMLNYGAKAQEQFKYNLSAPANADLSDEQKVLPAFADLNLVKTNTIPTTPFKPAQSGMQLGDVVYMQFLVAKSNVDAAGVLTYTIGSEDAVEIAVADLETYSSYYLINIPIKAKNVRTDISVSFTAENYTMTCSIEAFAVAKEGTATETLVAALMAYGDATAALFG